MVKYLLGVVYVLSNIKKINNKRSFENFDLIEFLNNIKSNHVNKNIINSFVYEKIMLDSKL